MKAKALLIGEFSIQTLVLFPKWFYKSIRPNHTATIKIQKSIAVLIGMMFFASPFSPNAAAQVVVAWGYPYDNVTNAPSGLTNVVGIAAGAVHNLVILGNGSVVGWGNNGYGQTNVPTSLNAAIAVAAGDYHNLALKPDGNVVGWGLNNYGVINIPANLTNIMALTSGAYHSLALKKNRTGIAWGNNDSGQTSIPSGLTNVLVFAAGDSHSLALLSDGTVNGWGNNSYGQSTVPAGLTNVVAIAAGDYHSLALKRDGTVVGWGYSYYANPGNVSNVVAITARDGFSLALKKDGTVVSWGENSYNRLTVPNGLSNVVSLAAGQYHVLALKAASSSLCFTSLPAGVSTNAGATVQFKATASGNSAISYQWQFNGQNITGKTTSTLTLTNVTTAQAGMYRVIISNSFGLLPSSTAALTVYALPKITVQPQTQIAAGSGNATFSVTAQGTGLRYQWQFNGADIPNATNASFAVLDARIENAGDYRVIISNTAGFVTSSAASLTMITAQPLSRTVLGGSRTRFLVSANGASLRYQWQRNGTNLVGKTSATLSLTNVTTGQAGSYRVLIQNNGGTLTSWPAILTVTLPQTTLLTSSEQVYGSRLYTPPTNATDIVKVATTYYGYAYNLALHNEGRVTVWGNDYSTSEWFWFPPELSNVVSVAAGYRHGLALQDDGTVVGWGRNRFGENNCPVIGITDIAAGNDFSIGVRSDGTVVTWGTDYGSGMIDVATGLRNVIAVAADQSYHALALKSNGTIVSFGYSYYGQNDVPAGLSNVVAIADGHRFSMALKKDGTVIIWGSGQTNTPSGFTNVAGISAANAVAFARKKDGTVLAWTRTAVSPGISTPFPGISGAVSAAPGYQSLAVVGGRVSIALLPQNVVTNRGATAVFKVSATATSGILKYQWQLNGTNVAGATASSLTLPNIQPSQAGTYTVIVRDIRGLTQNASATLTVAYALRLMPLEYWPNKRQSVTIRAVPPTSANGYAVEEMIPYGWTVGTISHGGQFDGTKIRWGFLDNTIRTLTYEVIPPSYGSDGATFDGILSFNGSDNPILGDKSMTMSLRFHPADTNPAADSILNINELTAYAAAWKRGEYWSVPPNPIPISYVTQSGVLWKGGETYHYAEGSPPLCWTNGRSSSLSGQQSFLAEAPMAGAAAALNNSAVCTMTNRYLPSMAVAVKIIVSPKTTIAAYAVEDTLPAGWRATNITQGGIFDVLNRKVKWGLLLDSTTRTLAYNAIPPSVYGNTVTFSGRASFDGTNVAITGQRQLLAPVVITAQPADQVAAIGQDIVVRVGAVGSTPLKYQWRRNGIKIAAGTNSYLVFPSITTNSAASYSVVITNSLGAVTSRTATLKVYNCSYTVSPTAKLFSFNGGTGSVSVNAAVSVCPWSVANTNNWITIVGTTSRTGTGSVTFSVATNSTTLPRTGTFRVAGKTFTVGQGGQFAPADIRGKTLVMNIQLGSGTVPSTGRYLAVASSGTNNLLQIVPLTSGITTTNVAYIFGRRSATSAYVGYTDLVTTLNFTNATKGKFSVSKVDGSWQTGYFILENNTPDLDGNGRPDIVWQNSTNRTLLAWLMTGTNYSRSVSLRNGAAAPTGWKALGSADFNSDGQSDVLFQTSTGSLSLWLLNRTNWVRDVLLRNGTASGPGWNAVAASDFTADNKPDVLFQNDDGRLALWIFNGTNFVLNPLLRDGQSAGSGLRALATGDFNGDRQTDILFEHTAGTVTLWLMNARSFIMSTTLASAPTVSSTWRIAGAGDFNADGETDILWKTSDGKLYIWLMNGRTYVRTVSLRGGAAVSAGLNCAAPK